ncbi:hypothetical protein M9Y10_031796 [Tritrichomonas musculus]|uniref:DUF3447 domain-containing protein n=1 Tax=Tritrichomonas musculus TaxID=1915356 RepID=A0ABR2H0V6_9EUKA
MEIQSYLEKMKAIQNSILTFIGTDENDQDNYLNLNHLFEHNKIQENQHELKSVLYLLSKISMNYHRGPNFFKKLYQILDLFKTQIKQYFTNFEIFSVFHNNRKILLYLFDQKLVTVDRSIVATLTEKDFKTAKYPQYFFPELKPFLSEDMIEEIQQEIPENFEEKRENEVNENPLYELIRNNSIDEFMEFVKKNNISLTSTIQPSIFETNPYLVHRTPSLIEYSAFFGSTKIFHYLYMNHIELTPSLYLYAIHGKNPEFLHVLETSKIMPEDSTYEECFREAVKCHHHEIANEILNEIEDKKLSKYFSTCLKYYNFEYMDKECINESAFFDLCQYGYFPLVQILLKDDNINVNSTIVL